MIKDYRMDTAMDTTTQPHSTSSVHQNMSEQEWQMRVNLAACYRLIASYG